MTIEELPPGFRGFPMTDRVGVCTVVTEIWRTNLRQAMYAKYANMYEGSYCIWIYGMNAATRRSDDAKNKT